MESIVKDLLDELYGIEPSLKKQEKHLTKIIQLMIQNVPQSQMNPEFKKELRKEILQKIQKQKKSSQTWYMPFLSGISVCGLLVFVGFHFFDSLQMETPRLSFVPSIEHTTESAFDRGAQGGISAGNPSHMRTEQSPMMPTGVGKISGDRMMLAMPAPVRYTYSYTGKLTNPTGKLTNPTGKLTVYKRSSLGFTNSDTSSFIQGLRIDGLDTRAFDHAGISNLSISEDRDFGYNIGIDFGMGTVNFAQNYPRWPQGSCDANGCKELAKLNDSDIPTDEALMRITDDFIRKYGIDVSHHAKPIVYNAWKTNYTQMKQEGIETYIPETFTVTYPIQIDKHLIYEGYSGYKGLSFTVDIRSQRVSGMTGLGKHQLIASDYPVRDESRIQKLIVSGGQDLMVPTEGAKEVTLSLGEPKLEYIIIYGEWKDNIASNYYVPAYIFPVMSKEVDNSYVGENVIIPLVDGFDTPTPPVAHPSEPIMLR